MVEGYNTATIAPHLTGLNNQNNTVEDFLREIDRATPYNFNDNLEQAGYDLIYIDFNFGTDDIRRNAALFEEVLRWVNTQKQNNGSAEPNVVMGESMGGLVARYGLARLVRGGYNPQTRLLVLHDSPQRGANNPMGLQALTRQADFPVPLPPGSYAANPSLLGRTPDLSIKLKEALLILEAPATKQLSLKNVTGINYEYENNSFIDGPYKDVVDFGGAPPATFPPIVATSDGSQCGRPQSTPAYQELTRNDRAYLLFNRNFVYDNGIRTEAIANGLPAYGTQNTIAHLRIWFEIRVLWLSVTVPFLNRNFTSPANTLPYETLPGGTSNLYEQKDLLDKLDFNIGVLQAFDLTSLYNGGICFVPTYSALDVPTVTSATAYAKYVNNVTDNPSPPRVASYIAQENITGSNQFNQAHIRFTARNSEWIYRQMENLPLASNYCSNECQLLTINSSLPSGQRLCAGNAITLSIPGLAPGTVVTWAATPASFFTTTAGSGPTFTTTAAASATGFGTITATVGPCRNPVSINVPVGPGEPSGRYVVGAFFSGSGTPLQTTNPAGPDKVNIVVDAPYNFTFTADPSSVSVSSLGSGQASFYMPASGVGVTITATSTNATSGCGVVGHWTFIPTPYRLSATPNPASTDLTVSLTDPASPAPADPVVFDADLYDMFGKKVKTKRSEGGKAILDVRDLPEGIYVVRVNQGKKTLSENIQIKH